MTCHDQAGTAPASPLPSGTSSPATEGSAGSANTPAPRPSTTSNPPPPDPTSSGTPPTGEPHTSQEPATHAAASNPTAPAPATPDDEPTHPSSHPPADGDQLEVEVREVWAIRFPGGALSGGMYSDDGSDHAEQTVRFAGQGNEIVHRTVTITSTPWVVAE